MAGKVYTAGCTHVAHPVDGDETACIRPLTVVVLERIVLSATLAALAAPRDDVMDAYIDAAEQLHLLELDAALAALDAAVARARHAGIAGDPSLAAVHAMRAGLLQALGHPATEVEQACASALRIDPLALAPAELRSRELVAACDAVRSSAPTATGGIRHRPPEVSAADEIEFVATSGVPIPDGGQLVLYWRRAGASEYQAVEMALLGNFGRARVAAQQHAGDDLEYFMYVFDAALRPVANVGDRDRPLKLRMLAAVPQIKPAPAGAETSAPTDRPVPSTAATPLPRVILGLGLGTGLGIARGTAEQTYAQMLVGTDPAAYTRSDQACAITRWAAGGAPLPQSTSGALATLGGVAREAPQALPGGTTEDALLELASAYDPARCRQRHPIRPGVASAPLHIEPEVAVRVHRALYVAAFARLQVVTGSRVFTENPQAPLPHSFDTEVSSTMPRGHRRRPPFTWAVGLKLKYFVGRKARRLRPFIGAFAGYGSARLRVPLGFANDRNGNSVPDDRERPAAGPLGEDDRIEPGACTTVWPYLDGCDDEDAATRAKTLIANTGAKDRRIDTVRIGPGFAGALAGVHFQATRHFALTAEVQVGAWFPATSSALADLNFGPAVTF